MQRLDFRTRRALPPDVLLMSKSGPSPKVTRIWDPSGSSFSKIDWIGCDVGAAGREVLALIETTRPSAVMKIMYLIVPDIRGYSCVSAVCG